MPIVRVLENRAVGPGTSVLVTNGGEAFAGARPGQFTMLRGDWGRDPLLPRAFSILAVDGERVSYLVKAAGRGTRLLLALGGGDRLHALGPLGRPFPSPADGKPDLLVAGGVGQAPLLWHARDAGASGLHAQTTLFYGARAASDLVLGDEIAAAGCALIIATEDGSRGHHGRITAALLDHLDEHLGDEKSSPRVLSCGPNPMMRAVAELTLPRGLETLLSLEGEMACGIGACLGCAVPSVPGAEKPFRYCCVDGPVFDAREIIVPGAAPVRT